MSPRRRAEDLFRSLLHPKAGTPGTHLRADSLEYAGNLTSHAAVRNSLHSLFTAHICIPIWK